MTEAKIVYLYLTLIRHGETSENLNNIIQGHLDTDLSPTGVRQASLLKEYLCNLRPDFLISSDLKRAINTALALGLSTPLEFDARLRERNFGKYCGSARRELQTFAQKTANAGHGCDGWRSVGAECSHQMAARTSVFLVELCSRLAKRINATSFLPPSPSPVLAHSDMAPMPAPIAKVFSPSQNFVYGGHVVMVSHGGWIRQLLRLLAFQSEHSYNFPKECANSVMRNCGVCQVGVAFNPDQLEAYRHKNPDLPQSVSKQNFKSSLIPAFGTLFDTGVHSSCPFSPLAVPQLPLTTVCYLFDRTASDLGALGPILATSQDTKHASVPAEMPCSKMEVIFSDDADEYAGQPDSAPQTTQASTSK